MSHLKGKHCDGGAPVSCAVVEGFIGHVACQLGLPQDARYTTVILAIQRLQKTARIEGFVGQMMHQLGGTAGLVLPQANGNAKGRFLKLK